jgi:hypothetical protein
MLLLLCIETGGYLLPSLPQLAIPRDFGNARHMLTFSAFS